MRLTGPLLVFLLAACGGEPRTAASPAVPVPAPAAAWWQGAVFYEVFVRSFADSNGDGKGDLSGLIDHLDYLNDGDPRTSSDLGVDALWLMPVFASPSYHGYDVIDYEQVNADYGTNGDLDRLIAEAHRRGMRVVLDLVLNHTSNQHPWFQESASSPGSPRRDWYVWRPDDPAWKVSWRGDEPVWHERGGAWYYAIFWSGMPDLNYRTAAVREEAKRIARSWLSRGVDGFRLDAIPLLIETGPGAGVSSTPETHAFLKELARAVKEAKADAMLVGEVASTTAEIAGYFGTGTDEIDVLFDFPLATALIEGVKAGRGQIIAEALEHSARAFPPGAVYAPFLTNHDQLRVANQLSGDEARLRVAASILLSLPGAPFIWQGEELGMRQSESPGDVFKRTPLPWSGSPGAGFTTAAQPWQPLAPGWEAANVAVESADPASLLGRYRRLIRARQASPALRLGDLSVIRTSPAVLACVRRGGGETVLAAHNLGDAPAEELLPDPAGAAASPIFVDPGASLAKQGRGWRMSLPARSSAIWRVR
jgi:glycosidase